MHTINTNYQQSLIKINNIAEIRGIGLPEVQKTEHKTQEEVDQRRRNTICSTDPNSQPKPPRQQ